MTYIMSCIWLDYMIKYFRCKNCVRSSSKTKMRGIFFSLRRQKQSLEPFCAPGFFFFYGLEPHRKAYFLYAFFAVCVFWQIENIAV